MALVAEKYQKELERLKQNVDSSKKYFRENNSRYTNFRSFLFNTAITQADQGVADELDRPALEVNILETYVSHLMGEFTAQTPSPQVNPIMNDPKLADQALIVEGHIRSIFESSKQVQATTFRNTLSGGYSVIKVTTDYVNSKSFDQAIYLKSPLDDTQTGFDPKAKESHKGDGQYCYEMIPKTKDELKLEFPEIDLEKINFNKGWSDGFEWYYTEQSGNEKLKVVNVCSYFEKKKVLKTLYRISDPSHPDNMISIEKEKYDELIKQFDNTIAVPPVILEASRRAETKIIHWQFTGDQVLSREETDYEILPFVFIDGNSIMLKQGQMTRPYIYHAMDVQKMKNTIAQNIMNDVENMRQTDIFIAKESIPQEPEFRMAWMNPQKANAALPFNFFSETNDNAQLPLPQIIPRQQISPAVLQMYQIVDQSLQSVLGSYDAQQGIQKDMSGVAIENGAIQSNNAAKPYKDNYLEGMNQVCKIILNLIPKYYNTLRTIPIVNSEGIRSYQIINDSIKNPIFKIEYDDNDLQCEVTMDQSFEVQKSRFIQIVQGLIKLSPVMNEFFSTDGMPLILDNIVMKDIAKVKQQYAQFVQKKEQQMQKQQEMQQQMNPAVIQMKNAQIKAQTDEKALNVDLIKAFMDKKIEDRKADTADAATQAKVLESQGKLIIAGMSANAENKRSDVEAAIAVDRHFQEKLQSDRDHLLKTMELGADIHATRLDHAAKMSKTQKGASPPA
jgi:hypothetical protein